MRHKKQNSTRRTAKVMNWRTNTCYLLLKLFSPSTVGQQSVIESRNSAKSGQIVGHREWATEHGPQRYQLYYQRITSTVALFRQKLVSRPNIYNIICWNELPLAPVPVNVAFVNFSGSNYRCRCKTLCGLKSLERTSQ